MKKQSYNLINGSKYEVAVRFPGSDGWEKICECKTRQQAEEEIEHQRTIEDDGDCEYTIIERSKGRPPKGKETRKAVTFRLQPATISLIREAAITNGISQSDLIESLVKDLEG